MNKVVLASIVLAVYAIFVVYLAIRGWKKSKSIDSYAVGAGDIPPIIVGLSLSASLTSVATFVTNPGLVYAYGISAILGFGVAAALGITLGLVFFSKAFRAYGAKVHALTIPQWIGTRYKSKPLSVGFAFLSLALLSFVVLIIVALSKVLGQLMNTNNYMLISVILVLFVFSYVMIGGVNTHAYTNAIQAIVMLVVALILIGSGIHTIFDEPGIISSLGAIDKNLTTVINPKSLFFRNIFEVFVCNFFVGLAIVVQPHILSKTLYLKKEKDVNMFLLTTVIAGGVFASVMLVGLFARKLYNTEVMTAIISSKSLDDVVTTYIKHHFSGGMNVVVSVGLLFAGLSTLEGLLIGISSIISVDLYLGMFGDTKLKDLTLEQKGFKALKVGRWSFLFIGIIALLLARWQLYSPTQGSVVIFAMFCMYILISSSLVPIVAGMFISNAKRKAVTASSISAVVTYLLLFIGNKTFGTSPLFALGNNPAFLGGLAIFVSIATFAIAQYIVKVED